MMWRRIVSSHLKTLTRASASPRRTIVCNPVLSANRSANSVSSSDFLRHFRSESECRFSPYEHIKTLAAPNLAAAAPPRRFVVYNPVGLLLAANRSAIFASSTVFPRHFSSESETSGKKNVEDAMCAETRNEIEELERKKLLDSEGPFGTKKVPMVAMLGPIKWTLVAILGSMMLMLVRIFGPLVGMLLMIVGPLLEILGPLVGMLLALSMLVGMFGAAGGDVLADDVDAGVDDIGPTHGGHGADHEGDGCNLVVS